MSLAKRSSHPSVAERMAIDADRLLNYRDKRYKLASDGSLRDSKMGQEQLEASTNTQKIDERAEVGTKE